MSNGFTINDYDKFVYVKDTNNGYVIVCLYVDDMLILGSNNYIITTSKKMLFSKFNMKDLGVADVTLGIKISITSGGLILSQSHYIEKLLDKFDKDERNISRTPVDINIHLSKNIGQSISQLEYYCIIGSLMYVMNCTRPDYSILR